MRPTQPWGVLNRIAETKWTTERLRRTVRRFRLVAGIKAAAPDRTLQQIAAQLEAMHERTPRGGTRWHPSSVKYLLDQADRRGFSLTATT